MIYVLVKYERDYSNSSYEIVCCSHSYDKIADKQTEQENSIKYHNEMVIKYRKEYEEYSNDKLLIVPNQPKMTYSLSSISKEEQEEFDKWSVQANKAMDHNFNLEEDFRIAFCIMNGLNENNFETYQSKAQFEIIESEELI